MLKKNPLECTVFFFLIAVIMFFSGLSGAAAEETADVGAAREQMQYDPEQLDEIMNRLQDPLRQLLADELSRSPVETTVDRSAESEKGILSFLSEGMECSHGQLIERLKAIVFDIPQVPAALHAMVDRLTEGKGWGHFLLSAVFLILIFLAGWAVEKYLIGFTKNFQKRIDTIIVTSGIQRFVAALIKIIPELFGIVLFIAVTLLLNGVLRQFFNLPQTFVMTYLLVLVISRTISAFSRMFCSPGSSELRLIPLDDGDADSLLHAIVLSTVVWTFLLFTGILMDRLGLEEYPLIIIGFFCGAFAMVTIAWLVWKNREPVALAISGVPEGGEPQATVREHFASVWHVFAWGYLAVTMTIWSIQLFLKGPQFNLSSFMPVLIVPIYIVVDRIAQWVLSATIGTIRHLPGNESEGEDELDDQGYARKASIIVRLIVFLSFLFGLLAIWGVQIPFARQLGRTTVDVLVTLALAHVVWRMINDTISRKLAESIPEASENKEEEDEWGGQPMDRSFTLLPMIRKFVGVTLVVMVTLIVLSSIGVEIGPLLAGAGVIGLAVGFGAQKLVSDILSGIFFLIDDTFRVGEYVESGAVSGSVEKVTLRNLWLRHHRGMLQIIPFSDLGSITNFMRGGIIVKFNLQLPYDTDIEKVRKIIKKVGKKMLKDEELGPDFIKPIKSQGVRSVGDSVMTFRVKFTAQPGKHFMIRREAFRRITEALAEKGIQYAHRKVIVDLPPELKDEKSFEKEGLSDEQEKALLSSGAAALQTTIQEKAGEKTKKE